MRRERADSIGARKREPSLRGRIYVCSHDLHCLKTENLLQAGRGPYMAGRRFGCPCRRPSAARPDPTPTADLRARASLSLARSGMVAVLRFPSSIYSFTARMRSSCEYMDYLEVVQVFVRTPRVSVGCNSTVTAQLPVCTRVCTESCQKSFVRRLLLAHIRHLTCVLAMGGDRWKVLRVFEHW